VNRQQGFCSHGPSPAPLRLARAISIVSRVKLPSVRVAASWRPLKTNLGCRGRAILTAVRAGLREGEIAALQWGDFQFGDSEKDDGRYILVQRNYDRRWSRRMLTPKGKKPRRVDMSRELRRMLMQLRDEAPLNASVNGKNDISDELAFPSEAGTPIEMSNFSERVFKALASHAGSAGAAFTTFATPTEACSFRPAPHSPGTNVGFVDRLDSAMTSQESARRRKKESWRGSTGFKQVLGNEWLGGRDSNPDTQIQSLQSYR
jgi:integrase